MQTILSIAERFNHSCIERGYHYLGGEKVVKQVELDTPEECQLWCNDHPKCNWFSWSDASLPNGCWLLSKNGVDKNYDKGRDQGANGPKTCDGK